MLYSEQTPEYDKSDTYYGPPIPSNRKILGRLCYLPFFFSFCVLGYYFLNTGTLLTMRTATKIILLIIIPFSFCLGNSFKSSHVNFELSERK